MVTFETRRPVVSAPEDTTQFVAPNPKRLERGMAGYLTPSQFIESNDPEIKRLAGQIGVDRQTAWEHVEAIYDFVREKIEYKEDKTQPPKGAVGALHDGTGACDEMTFAVCRPLPRGGHSGPDRPRPRPLLSGVLSAGFQRPRALVPVPGVGHAGVWADA